MRKRVKKQMLVVAIIYAGLGLVMVIGSTVVYGTKGFIAFGAAWLAFVAVLLCSFVLDPFSRRWRLYKKAKAHNWCVPGTAVKAVVVQQKSRRVGDDGDTYNDDITTYRVFYRYEVNGQTYHVKSLYSAPRGTGYPAQETIFYDLHNPAKAVPGGEMDREPVGGRAGCLLSVVISAVVLGVLINVLGVVG